MWLPTAFVLDKLDVLAAVGVTYSYEERIGLASDENILFVVDGESILCKNGNGAIITYFFNIH